MSKDKTDAQVAREWAARFIKHADNAQIVDADEITAARYIMATTTAPTMADVRWDDDVHAGLCAEHADGGVVRMICLGWASDLADHILCYLRPGAFDSLPMSSLTPLPGTRVDLTPRHEPEPEFAPDHPEFLETEEDYENAPEGAIVAQDEGKPFVLIDELWRVANYCVLDHGDMAGIRRRVLRRGWEA